MPDLTAYTDTDLDALRVDVLIEQERRATAASAPARIEQSTRDAVRAGADPDVIRAAVDDGLTPREEIRNV